MAATAPKQPRKSRRSGYGAIWAGGSPPAELDWVEPILEPTTTLQVATGIVNIWTAAAGPVAESFHRIDKAYPGRFLLGIGVGHPEAHQRVPKPYDALTRLPRQARRVRRARRTAAWWPRSGPQVLKLSARRSAGAHPYLTTPEHTAQARELIGPDAFLAPEHKVVLTTDAEKARAVGRKALDIYLNLANYLQQLEAAGLHRRRRRQAGQRPPGRRGRRLRHGRADRGAAEGAPRRGRRPRARAGADRVLTSWCLHSPNWPGRSACSRLATEGRLA